MEVGIIRRLEMIYNLKQGELSSSLRKRIFSPIAHAHTSYIESLEAGKRKKLEKVEACVPLFDLLDVALLGFTALSLVCGIYPLLPILIPIEIYHMEKNQLNCMS
jgi:hypothetical protein